MRTGLITNALGLMPALEFPKIWNVIDYMELIQSNINLIWESSYTGQSMTNSLKLTASLIRPLSSSTICVFPGQISHYLLTGHFLNTFTQHKTTNITSTSPAQPGTQSDQFFCFLFTFSTIDPTHFYLTKPLPRRIISPMLTPIILLSFQETQ